MSLTNANKITLRLLDPVNGQPMQHWEFAAPTRISIGRGNENDVVIGSPSVSRQHVELFFNTEGWQLRSLGRNGTLVDGERVAAESRLVRSGALIQLGGAGPSLEFCEGDAVFRSGETLTNLHVDQLGLLQVDEQKKQAEVEKITGDEGFQQLLQKAQALRRKPTDETTG